MAVDEFKAKNNMSARDLFINRSLYSGFAFSDGEEVNFEPKSTKNLWFLENLFYGRVRQKGSEIFVIEPKIGSMSSIAGSSQSTPTAVLDFVKNAYDDFRREFNKGKVTEIHFDSESEYLSTVNPTRAFTRIDKKYETHQSKLYSSFASFINSDEKLKNKITSFESFVSSYSKFIYASLVGVPYTRSAFSINRFSTPMSSGLCVEIADLPHGSDEEKVEFFIKDCNFEYYSVLAGKHGFAVDKNAPWRLIADISSPKMLEYASAVNSSVSSSDDILELYYENTYEKELSDLQKNVILAYNSFCSSYPRSFVDTVKDGKKTTLKIERKTETRDSIVGRVGMDTWLKMIVNIKNIENNLGMHKSEISKIIHNAESLEKSFDTSRALGYINRRMPTLLALEGSLNFEYNLNSANSLEPSGVEVRKNVRKSAAYFNKNTY
jgi:hypothetical protein